MNRKITKLIKECYIVPPVSQIGSSGIPDLVKLVNSTIQECIKIANEHDGGRVGEIEFQIKRHFGIKE